MLGLVVLLSSPDLLLLAKYYCPSIDYLNFSGCLLVLLTILNFPQIICSVIPL